MLSPKDRVAAQLHTLLSAHELNIQMASDQPLRGFERVTNQVIHLMTTSDHCLPSDHSTEELVVKACALCSYSPSIYYGNLYQNCVVGVLVFFNNTVIPETVLLELCEARTAFVFFPLEKRDSVVENLIPAHMTLVPGSSSLFLCGTSTLTIQNALF